MKNTLTMLLACIIILSVLTFFYPVENCIANGATIEVDDDGGADYTTIQAAINAANSGDTIYVYSGTYSENIEISKDLTLTGENKDTTIIEGENNGHVIDINGERFSEIEFHISGFTIQNAKGTGWDCLALSFVNDGTINGNKIISSAQDDGIQMDHCNGNTISDNIISENGNGAGIRLTLDSENNNIFDNTIQNNNKGIYIYNSDSNQIYSNTISGSAIGIHIYTGMLSTGNYFYLNDLKNNVKNAEDPYTNFWSKNSQGNKWDDYTGSNRGDGIGDIPYDVPGGGGNQDEYPIGYFYEGNQQPVAVIQSISPNPATGGESISFDGSGTDSDGSISAWEWKVDGVVVSDSEDFSSSSFSIGTHSVTFRVQDNEGYWSDEVSNTFTVSIQQNNEPTVTIVFPQDSKTAIFGESVRFFGSGSDSDTGDTISYSWTSDKDGFLSSSSDFYKSDLSVNTHIITLRVTDNHGAYSEESRTLIINPDPSVENDPPIAGVGGPYSGVVNTSVSFDGSSSYDNDEGDSITDYTWDFGDGSIGYGITVEHVYAASGTYTVSLTVKDNHGETATNVTSAAISIQSNGQNGNGEENGESPGFGIIFVLIASVLVLFWIKKGKGS